VEEEVEGIGEDKKPSGTSVEQRTPPPGVIFSCELEIKERDGDERSHDDKHDEGEEQDAEQRVDLVSPDGSEYIVKLNIDRRKWQKACHEELCDGVLVPCVRRRDFPWHLVGATRGSKFVSNVASYYGAYNSQREVHKEND